MSKTSNMLPICYSINIMKNPPSPQFKTLPPLTLYIHTPWCVQKCPYCDFNSHTLNDDLPEENYIDCLLNDLEASLEGVQGRSLQAIFIGGGTPSLFSPRSMGKLLWGIKDKINCADDIEITLEANPGTVEAGRFSGYADVGINRISLGIQSFNDAHLKCLGRIHSAEEAMKAITLLNNTSIQNFNLDLMFGLPHQTIEQGLKDLKQAIAFKPTHLSWYQLTLEPHTPFFRQPPPLPSDDLIGELFDEGKKLLSLHHYNQYEVSAYTGDTPCRHNLNYWEFGDYLGIGAGAHNKITSINDQTITRSYRHKHPKQYMKHDNDFIAEKNVIPASTIILEFMLNALRLNRPIEIALFEERTGLPFRVIEEKINLLCDNRLMNLSNEVFSTTEKGYLHLNEVLLVFVQ